MSKDNAETMFGIVFIVVIILMVIVLFVPMIETGTNVETHDIYYCKAPIGIYYADVEGSGGIFFTHIESSLGEGYVIKYLDNGELMTILPDSTSKDTHLYLTSDTDHMTVTIIEHMNWISVIRSEYYIYIPDPALMGDQ